MYRRGVAAQLGLLRAAWSFPPLTAWSRSHATTFDFPFWAPVVASSLACHLALLTALSGFVSQQMPVPWPFDREKLTVALISVDFFNKDVSIYSGIVASC